MRNWCPRIKMEFAFVELKFSFEFVDTLLCQMRFGCTPNSMFASREFREKGNDPVGFIDPMTKPGLSSHGPGLVASPWRNKMESTRMCQTCELESSVLKDEHMCRALRPCHSAVFVRLENKASMGLI